MKPREPEPKQDGVADGVADANTPPPVNEEAARLVHRIHTVRPLPKGLRRPLSPKRGGAPGAELTNLAVVTGASSGIGAAFARRLAQGGKDLLLTARRKNRLETLALELESRNGIRCQIHEADLSRDDEVTGLLKQMDELGPASLVVHSAGFGTRALFHEVDPQKPPDMIAVHDTAPVRLFRHTLPAMRRSGYGGLILVSSLAAFYTTKRYTMYSATKAFANMFCRGLFDELKGTGVKVQALCPGLTRTEFFSAPDYAKFDYDRVPDFMWMEPAEVVEESLQALAKNRRPVFIPGRANRLFVKTMESKVVGEALNLGLGVAERIFGELW